MTRLRCATEEPDQEVAVADEFVTDGPLVVLDLTEFDQPRSFELDLPAGDYAVDLRESGSGASGAQVIMLLLLEDEEGDAD